uniref:Uncharacterized protein n=1 Tax=Caenorhabditis japonica TaxID=281687 RepID=A0A8R1IAK7_CAEJA
MSLQSTRHSIESLVSDNEIDDNRTLSGFTVQTPPCLFSNVLLRDKSVFSTWNLLFTLLLAQLTTRLRASRLPFLATTCPSGISL